MSKRKFMPFGVMILLLVVALAAMGVGYGLWFENLHLDGTVNTGSVDVEFSGPYLADGSDGWYECVHMNGGACEDELQEKASAANCTVTNDGSLFGIAIVGAYPSWQCEFGFDIHSTGSVPVHFAVREAPAPPAWLADDPGEFVCEIRRADTTVEPLASLNDNIQLHQGDEVYCYVQIHFDNLDNVAQNDTIHFGYDIQAFQYNESEDWSKFP